MLLFLVLFFVYPLKFVFSNVIPAADGPATGASRDMSEADNRMMMWVYSAGFVAMMVVFVLLYWNRLPEARRRCELSDEQAFDARAGARTHAVSVLRGPAIGGAGADGADPVDLDRRRHLRAAGAAALAQRRAYRAARAKRFLHRAATRDSASFIDASAPLSSSRERQVQKRM